MSQTRLHVVPVTQRFAKDWISLWHRHHKPSVGAVFCVAVADDEDQIRGVAMVGRPVARMLQDGVTLEVTRVATDGCENACSALYGAAWRAAKALGWKRLVTYILDSEPGTSLKATGWNVIGECGGGSWSRDDRERTDDHPLGKKVRYEVAV